MRGKKKRHPTNTHIQTEMDTTDKMVRLCGTSHQLRHNSKNYPNVGASSTT